ncbi:MAG: response regulator [Acidobacteria bacterium]|nr:response regulator [Acidobacteriota bacterium]
MLITRGISPVSSVLLITPVSFAHGLKQPAPVGFPPSFVPALPDARVDSAAPFEAGIPVPNIQAQADQIVLQDYSPAAVLTGEKGDILYISGRTGKYLEPAAGKANWNIFAMAREGLRFELYSGFQKALRQKSKVMLNGLKVRANGEAQAVNVTVQPLARPPALQGTVLIVFTDIASPPETKAKGRISPVRTARMEELEHELQQVRRELQTAREQMQTSREELKSANEEMQSTNEELQSTNEELTTSKEEMQSMNEELQTVNSELQAKVDELMTASNDMKNLLDSTGISTLFLDNRLNVRRFTPQTTSLIKLIPGEAGDGQQAVDMARRLRPNVAIMDVNMPGMNGIDATRIITSEDPQCRVIALSMYSEAEMETAMREAGAVHYLIKSGPSGALIDAIRSCVRAEAENANKTHPYAWV